jgi:hypothetical protein
VYDVFWPRGTPRSYENCCGLYWVAVQRILRLLKKWEIPRKGTTISREMRGLVSCIIISNSSIKLKEGLCRMISTGYVPARPKVPFYRRTSSYL